MNKCVAMSKLAPLMAEALNNGKEVIFTVTGNSMMPMLRHRRDKVCLVKPQEQPLKKYDIPLFLRRDGKYILHRIVARKPEGYVITGDNQTILEYPVSHSQVIGVVKGFWRNGKYVSCGDIGYRAYCRVWVFLYLVRWIFLKGKRLLKKAVGAARLTVKNNGENVDEG